MRFNHIVSLGFFCGVSQELEKIGIREAYLPFDWVISNLKTVNELIENKFDLLFNTDYLYRDENYQYIVKHKNYNFDFYHDFDIGKTIEEQIERVRSKYNKRITRFYELLNSSETILFVCYINDSELEMTNEILKLITILNQYNLIYRIIFIKNHETILNPIPEDIHILHFFNTEKYKNDYVNRNFITDTFEINSFFQNDVEYNDKKDIKILF